MTANSQLLTTTRKTKTRANQENNQNRNRTTEMELTWRVINRGVGGERGGKGTENKQHKWQVENTHGEGKNSIGNVEAKELICMTHGHELQGGNVGGRGGVQDGVEWGGKWDNCNSIINKRIFFKKKNLAHTFLGEFLTFFQFAHEPQLFLLSFHFVKVMSLALKRKPKNLSVKLPQQEQ